MPKNPIWLKFLLCYLATNSSSKLNMYYIQNQAMSNIIQPSYKRQEHRNMRLSYPSNPICSIDQLAQFQFPLTFFSYKSVWVMVKWLNSLFPNSLSSWDN